MAKGREAPTQEVRARDPLQGATSVLVLASAQVFTTSFTGFTGFTGFTSFSLLKILCKVREIFKAEATVVDVEVTDDGEEVRSTCIAGTNISNFRY